MPGGGVEMVWFFLSVVSLMGFKTGVIHARRVSYLISRIS